MINTDTIRTFLLKHFSLLLFLGSLLVYTAVILLFQDSSLIGDEKRYMYHAQCIARGVFTPENKLMWLWNGPGYPLVILPFMLIFSDPVIPIRLLNALFLSAALILFYKSLLRFVPRKMAIYTVLAFACYVLIWKSLLFVLTEILTILLFTVLFYLIPVRNYSFKRVLAVGFFFGFLCMVKVVFGYVLTGSLIILTVYYFFNRLPYVRFVRNSLLTGLIFCIPWLGYTWSVSGKFFFWAASGTASLYWMSNPVPHEYGNWIDSSFESALGVPGATEGYTKSHGEEVKRINALDKIERHDEYKRIAIENIRNHPRKFLLNIWSNAGRFFFNYPFDYYPQQPSTLINVFINGPLLGLMLFFAVPTFRNFKRLPFQIRFFLLFFTLYTGLSFLLSAYIRMFYIFIPVIFSWLAFMIHSTKIRIEKWE